MFKKFKSIWFMYNPIINIEIAELEKIRCLVTDIWFWMETTINWNEFGIFMFFAKMCPLLIGILSVTNIFYHEILSDCLYYVRKMFFLHFLIIILIWEKETTQKCFTHIDWQFAMTANLPLRVLFHHRMYFIFFTNLKTIDNNGNERNFSLTA